MRNFFAIIRRFGGAGGWFAAGLLFSAAEAWALPATASDPPRIGMPATNPPSGFCAEALTLEQAERRALDCDRQIASLQAAVEVARQQRLAATDLKDPELQSESRSVGRSDKAAGDELDNSRVRLGVYLPNPMLTVPRVHARTADYQAARADLGAATWRLRCQVRQLFAQLDYLTNDLAYSADRVRLNRLILQAVQARVSQGAATATEFLTASRQFLQFQDDLDQTRHRYQLARRQLAALLELAPEAFTLAPHPAPGPISPPLELNFAQAEAMALDARYDQAALRWRARAAVSAYHEIRNERLPWVRELKVGYIDNSLKDSDRYRIGLDLDIPIFSWTKNHAAAAARARAALADVEESNGLKLIRQELRDGLDELEETGRQLARNEQSVTPLIATMRQTLATLKNTPNLMPDQVAAAELQLAETLRLDLATRWQYELARLNFERILGAPLNPAPAGF